MLNRIMGGWGFVRPTCAWLCGKFEQQNKLNLVPFHHLLWPRLIESRVGHLAQHLAQLNYWLRPGSLMQ